jgi:hypothetical protein
LQPGDIEKALDNYRVTRNILSPLIDLVINLTTRQRPHDLDPEKSLVFEDDEAIAVQLYSNKNLIPVLFIFWLDNDRFSLFIEDKEVIDEFLNDGSEVEKTLACATTILRHEIFRVRYTRKGKIRKVIYTYATITENGTIVKHEDQSVLAITMPWHKNERSEHNFDPWL